MKLKTTAQKIARMFQSGTSFESKCGCYEFEDVCDSQPLHEATSDGYEKWVFRDGSVLVSHHTYWDFGYKHCYCCVSYGHAHDCSSMEGQHDT